MWKIFWARQQNPKDVPIEMKMYLRIVEMNHDLRDMGNGNYDGNGIGDIKNNDIDTDNDTDIDTDLLYSGLLNKLKFVQKDLSNRATAFVSLRNLPNITFKQFFDEIGPQFEATVRGCSNAGVMCDDFGRYKEFYTGYFPKCYTYNTQGDRLNNIVSEIGISNGVQLLLMTDCQLASVGVKMYSKLAKENDGILLPPGFQNTDTPFSTDGIRLVIHHPGEGPVIDHHAINISPGYSTVVAISGKQIIKLPAPYSQCTNTDHELVQLQQSLVTATSMKNYGEIQTNDDLTALYSQSECHSTCLQRLIWEKCG